MSSSVGKIARILAGGTIIAILAIPAGAASLGVGASAGGGGGINAGAGASTDSSGGANGGLGASIGASNGATAGASVSVGARTIPMPAPRPRSAVRTASTRALVPMSAAIPTRMST